MLLNNQFVNEKKTITNKKHLEKKKRKCDFLKFMGCSKSNSHRDIHSEIGFTSRNK